MIRLAHQGCRLCGRHLSSSSADISNRKSEPENEGPKWWFCSRPRTPCLYDEHGVLIRFGQPCETNSCFDCVGHKVARVEKALHYVEPTALITINDVGLDPTEARKSMKALRRHLRTKTKIVCEDLYVLERYAEQDQIGLHAHMYAHGEIPNEDNLYRAADAAGINLSRRAHPVQVKTIRNHRNLTYFFKATEDRSTHRSFLDDNGGHLMSTTKRFWRIPGQAHAPQGYRGLLRQVKARL